MGTATVQYRTVVYEYSYAVGGCYVNITVLVQYSTSTTVIGRIVQLGLTMGSYGHRTVPSGGLRRAILGLDWAVRAGTVRSSDRARKRTNRRYGTLVRVLSGGPPGPWYGSRRYEYEYR